MSKKKESREPINKKVLITNIVLWTLGVAAVLIVLFWDSIFTGEGQQIFKGNNGFADSTPDKVEVTVQKAAGTISFAEAQVIKTVGDPNYTQTATKTGDGSVVYSWTNVSGGSAIDSVTGEITIGTTAGTYTVTATVTDGTNYHYATPTATYTFKILPKTSPDATVTPGNWGGSENTDLTPDRNGL